jgi:hypothetical protein
VFGDPRQHARTDFIAIVKSEDVVGESIARENAMGTASLAFNAPPDSQ